VGSSTEFEFEDDKKEEKETCRKQYLTERSHT